MLLWDESIGGEVKGSCWFPILCFFMSLLLVVEMRFKEHYHRGKRAAEDLVEGLLWGESIGGEAKWWCWVLIFCFGILLFFVVKLRFKEHYY